MLKDTRFDRYQLLDPLTLEASFKDLSWANPFRYYLLANLCDMVYIVDQLDTNIVATEAQDRSGAGEWTYMLSV